MLKSVHPSLLLVTVGKSVQGSELFLFSYCSRLWLMNSFQEGLHWEVWIANRGSYRQGWPRHLHHWVLPDRAFRKWRGEQLRVFIPRSFQGFSV